jgi:uncharacterized protein (TIGR02996 family)
VSERDAFLRKLDEDEDDTLTRLVYADWLDERGEHEEADRQRKWPAAKEWLVRFCAEHNLPDAVSYEWFISYEQLLELGRDAVDQAGEGRCGFSCGTNETMCDALRANRPTFWQNWSIVTGVPLPPDVENTGYFSCAC